VNLKHGSGCRALGFQAGVEALDVLGGEPVQAVFAEAGNDPVADPWCVRGFKCGAADTAWRDGAQPGFDPLPSLQRVTLGARLNMMRRYGCTSRKTEQTDTNGTPLVPGLTDP
jgi:hypothetical protein